MPIETIRESLKERRRKKKKRETKKPLKVCIEYVRHRASCTCRVHAMRPVYHLYITKDFDFLLTS